MDMTRKTPTRARRGIGCARFAPAVVVSCLWAAVPMAAVASGPGPEAVGLAFAEPSIAEPTGAGAKAPWERSIQGDTPIASMTALRTEYRRIRDARQAQLEPEYERRVSAEGQVAADAWRKETLSEVVRRDRRELRNRLDR